MTSRKNDILKDKDILGMDKPTNQLTSLKGKSNTWFLMMMIFILMIGAAMTYYFKH